MSFIASDFSRIDYDMTNYNWDVIAQKTLEVYDSLKTE